MASVEVAVNLFFIGTEFFPKKPLGPDMESELADSNRSHSLQILFPLQGSFAISS